MLGFLFKILIITVIVGGIGAYLVLYKGMSLSQIKLPVDAQILSSLKENANPNNLSQRVSEVLDSLVTHPDRNSPVVLGIKATNESVSVITDALLNMPNDKLDQVRQILCASPSAK